MTHAAEDCDRHDSQSNTVYNRNGLALRVGLVDLVLCDLHIAINTVVVIGPLVKRAQLRVQITAGLAGHDSKDQAHHSEEEAEEDGHHSVALAVTVSSVAELACVLTHPAAEKRGSSKATKCQKCDRGVRVSVRHVAHFIQIIYGT